MRLELTSLRLLTHGFYESGPDGPVSLVTRCHFGNVPDLGTMGLPLASGGNLGFAAHLV